jgi:hypothetical protein
VEGEELAKLKQIRIEFEKRKRDDLRHQLRDDQQWRENIGLQTFGISDLTKTKEFALE